MVSISDHFDLDINTVQALVHLSLCCLLHIYQECRHRNILVCCYGFEFHLNGVKGCLFHFITNIFFSHLLISLYHVFLMVCKVLIIYM